MSTKKCNNFSIAAVMRDRVTAFFLGLCHLREQSLALHSTARCSFCSAREKCVSAALPLQCLTDSSVGGTSHAGSLWILLTFLMV